MFKNLQVDFKYLRGKKGSSFRRLSREEAFVKETPTNPIYIWASGRVSESIKPPLYSGNRIATLATFLPTRTKSSSSSSYFISPARTPRRCIVRRTNARRRFIVEILRSNSRRDRIPSTRNSASRRLGDESPTTVAVDIASFSQQIARRKTPSRNNNNACNCYGLNVM